MSKHTPGPWMGPFIWSIQSPHVLTIGARINGDKDHLFTIDCEHGPVSVKEMEANVCLMAAAPELLEACKRAIRELKDGETTIGLEEDLEAAIAKAEKGKE